MRKQSHRRHPPTTLVMVARGFFYSKLQRQTMNIDILVSVPDEKDIQAEIDKVTMNFAGFEASPELVAVTLIC